MQTTLLGLAIAFILALIAALVGPYFIDWSQFRPQFEAEATRIIGAQVRVGGKLDARLLPAPSLQLHSVVVGGANDLGKVRADKLDVEFSLGSLMRGEWRATELTINGLSLDLGLDPKGRVDWPASTGSSSLGSLAIDRLNLTGRIALHDAASRGTLELNDIAFSGDVRSLAAGAVRGDGNFMYQGARYPFRVSSGQGPDGNGTRLHLNVDPGQRAFAADLDGILNFDARAPRFDGAVTLAVPAGQKGGGNEPPWRITAKIKTDYSQAKLEQIEATYGAEDRALKLVGAGDIRFGASPLLRASLSARQLDADKFVANDKNATEPGRVFSTLRALIGGVPLPPIPAQIELATEQVMLGGRPLQDVVAELHGDAKTWSVRKLEFRAPGSTRVSLSETGTKNAAPDQFKASLNIESSDPDALMTWLQGRGDAAFRSQKPLRLRSDVTIAPDGFTFDALKADIDGGAVEGRVAVSHRQANAGSKVDAQLKAERLDLDAATAFARSLAGPQGDWPEQGALALDIGTAISAGQELRQLLAKLNYGPKSFSLEQLKIGRPDSVMLEGAGNFDRATATGKLKIDSSAASFGQLTSLFSPFAPAVVTRLNAMGSVPGPARVKLSLDLDKGQGDRANARAVVDVDSPLLKGVTTITAKPNVSALQSVDLAALARSEISIESSLSSTQGRALLSLLGVNSVVAAGEGPAQFDGSAAGAWGASLRLKAKIFGGGLDADADGTAEPWAQDPKASLSLKVRSADLGPLLDLKPSDTLAQNIALTSRVSLAGNRLTFDDLDSTVAGSRLRGRVAVALGDEKSIDGEIGLDQLALAPAFALAIGAAGHDAAEPLGAGLVKGWRGKIAFQALRGLLPGGSEVQPLSGAVNSDGRSLSFDGVKGKIGGGDASANLDVRPSDDGVVLNASVQFSGADGSALHYRGLAMPAGRSSLQMTLSGRGRSAAALSGALAGSGTVTLEAARIAGLDPRAFEAATRVSDSGQVKDDAKLKQIVEPALAAGALSIASGQVPFTVRDGRIRVGATTLDGNGVRAIVSGGYDIPADQVDVRAALSLTTVAGRPEIQLFAVGTSDALSRSVDVAALSSWLSVRAIDHETKRLDAIERGEPPPPAPAPVVLPPQEEVPPPASQAVPSSEPLTPVPLPGRDPRKLPAKPKAVAPRPPAAPPVATAPAPVTLPPRLQQPPVATAPVAGQQVAPLPPPIDVKPAPAPKPKPKPPLALTPQVANPPPRPALQNSN